MTDKELLEQAAKAAGYIGTATEYPNGYAEMSLSNYFDPHGSNVWNPLLNDGQALRLAVHLHICIYTDGDSYVCGVTDRKAGLDAQDETGWVECRADDAFAATRRAIVRAAAALAA